MGVSKDMKRHSDTIEGMKAMQYRENGHIYSANQERLECDECGSVFQFGDVSASMERCSSAPNRFDNDGCFVIDTDTGELFGIADTPKAAEREAENESVDRLMVGDWGADEELSEQ